jgi:hypothetical protein
MTEHRVISERVRVDFWNTVFICPSHRFTMVVVVLLWPGFMSDSEGNRQTSIRVGDLNRAPHALCAKPAWWKPAPSTESGVIHYRPSGGRGWFQPSQDFIKLGALPDLFADGTSRSFHSCPFGHDSEFHKTPQIDHQPSRHGDNADASHSPSARPKASLVPLTEPAFWLIS